MVEALSELFVRLVAVVLCWVVALVVWDIGHNAPFRLVRARRGILRLAVGLGAACVALVALAQTLPPGTNEMYSVYAIGTFCTGFVVDLLIGDSLRAAVGGKR